MGAVTHNEGSIAETDSCQHVPISGIYHLISCMNTEKICTYVFFGSLYKNTPGAKLEMSGKVTKIILQWLESFMYAYYLFLE